MGISSINEEVFHCHCHVCFPGGSLVMGNLILLMGLAVKIHPRRGSKGSSSHVVDPRYWYVGLLILYLSDFFYLVK